MNNFERWKETLAAEDLFTSADTLTGEGCVGHFALGCDRCPANGTFCIKPDGFVSHDIRHCSDKFLEWAKSDKERPAEITNIERWREGLTTETLLETVRRMKAVGRDCRFCCFCPANHTCNATDGEECEKHIVEWSSEVVK